jgi:hypothetical protein
MVLLPLVAYVARILFQKPRDLERQGLNVSRKHYKWYVMNLKANVVA